MQEREARGGTLILGGGYAGAWVARLLGRDGATIVNLENFMLFTPLLPEAASGTLEPRHVVVPLRQMCPDAELLLGRVTGRHDAAARAVEVETEAETFSVHYDRLVVALGGEPRPLPVPGLAEHAKAFRTLADAIDLRNHVLRRLEAADAALSDAERRASWRSSSSARATPASRRSPSSPTSSATRSAHYPRLRDVPQRWVLVDAAAKILPEIPPRLGDYAARELMRRGIEIHV